MSDNDSKDVAIGVFEGKVVATWHEPLSSIVFDPANGYQIGLALCKAAMEAQRGNPDGKDTAFIEGELKQVKVVVTDAMRMSMVMSVATIVRTMLDQRSSPGQIASHCVDAVLRETAR